MLVGEIIALCVIFIMLPTIIWRLIYLGHKTEYDKFVTMTQFDALNKLQSTLNTTLNSVGVNTNAPTAELIKKIKVKKSKILDKLDSLIELISSRTGIHIVYENIMDTYTQEQILIKQLSEKEITTDIVSDYNLLKQIVYQLIKENKFPETDDFDYINKTYKKFKRMSKIKK